MITDKEFSQIKKLLHEENKKFLKVLHEDLLRIEKRLDSIDASVADKKGLKRIEVKLDKFMSIFDRLSKRYVVLEKKMRAIEEYFEHRN